MSPQSNARALPDLEAVREQLLGLQDRICEALEAEDGEARFQEQRLELPRGGLHRPRVLAEGPVLEKCAVHFSHTVGKSLPAAATERHPELEGAAYEAVSVSLIVHPRNPYAPTSHANFRFFRVDAEAGAPSWWFGGGFDLTPYYGFDEDCAHWHRTARRACDEHDPMLHPRMKRACDEYFRLAHRAEPRGIGGVFYDDFDEGGFARAFAVHRSISDAYLDAYRPILARRKDTPYGERERCWQLLRRGRYVEFNLLYDRGTRFGLEAGGRVESILASMPPLVRWDYDPPIEAGSPEALLSSRYLVPRDWADHDPTSSATV